MSTFAQRITMALDDLVGRALTWISMHEFLTDLHFDGGFVLRFEGSATYARHGRAVRVPQKGGRPFARRGFLLLNGSTSAHFRTTPLT